MNNLVYAMNNSFRNRNYEGALKNFYGYINSGNYELNLELARKYIQTLMYLLKEEQALSEIEEALKIWPEIYTEKMNSETRNIYA